MQPDTRKELVAIYKERKVEVHEMRLATDKFTLESYPIIDRVTDSDRGAPPRVSPRSYAFLGK